MARAALRAGSVLTLPAVLVADLTRGPEAGLTALAAIALVVGWFAIGSLPLGWAAGRSLEVFQAVALGGFVVRLFGFGLAMVALSPVKGIDGPVLALTVGLGTLILLTYEVVFVLSRPQLWWVASNAKETA